MKNNRLLIGFFFLWLMLVLFKFFDPGERDGKFFFQHLNGQDIQYIVLQPTTEGAPIWGAMKITSKEKIDRFLGIWKGVDTFIANHPKDRWSIHVKFYCTKGVYSGELRSTSNQGVMFEFNQGPSKWPVLSNYRLMKSTSDVDAVLDSLRLPDKM